MRKTTKSKNGTKSKEAPKKLKKTSQYVESRSSQIRNNPDMDPSLENRSHFVHPIPSIPLPGKQTNQAIARVEAFDAMVNNNAHSSILGIPNLPSPQISQNNLFSIDDMKNSYSLINQLAQVPKSEWDSDMKTFVQRLHERDPIFEEILAIAPLLFRKNVRRMQYPNADDAAVNIIDYNEIKSWKSFPQRKIQHRSEESIKKSKIVYDVQDVMNAFSVMDLRMIDSLVDKNINECEQFITMEERIVAIMIKIRIEMMENTISLNEEGYVNKIIQNINIMNENLNKEGRFIPDFDRERPRQVHENFTIFQLFFTTKLLTILTNLKKSKNYHDYSILSKGSNSLPTTPPQTGKNEQIFAVSDPYADFTQHPLLDIYTDPHVSRFTDLNILAEELSDAETTQPNEWPITWSPYHGQYKAEQVKQIKPELYHSSNEYNYQTQRREFESMNIQLNKKNITRVDRMINLQNNALKNLSFFPIQLQTKILKLQTGPSHQSLSILDEPIIQILADIDESNPGQHIGFKNFSKFLAVDPLLSPHLFTSPLIPSADIAPPQFESYDPKSGILPNKTQVLTMIAERVLVLNKQTNQLTIDEDLSSSYSNDPGSLPLSTRQFLATRPNQQELEKQFDIWSQSPHPDYSPSDPFPEQFQLPIRPNRKVETVQQFKDRRLKRMFVRNKIKNHAYNLLTHYSPSSIDMIPELALLETDDYDEFVEQYKDDLNSIGYQTDQFGFVERKLNQNDFDNDGGGGGDNNNNNKPNYTPAQLNSLASQKIFDHDLRSFIKNELKNNPDWLSSRGIDDSAMNEDEQIEAFFREFKNSFFDNQTMDKTTKPDFDPNENRKKIFSGKKSPHLANEHFDFYNYKGIRVGDDEIGIDVLRTKRFMARQKALQRGLVTHELLEDPKFQQTEEYKQYYDLDFDLNGNPTTFQSMRVTGTGKNKMTTEDGRTFGQENDDEVFIDDHASGSDDLPTDLDEPNMTISQFANKQEYNPEFDEMYKELGLTAALGEGGDDNDGAPLNVDNDEIKNKQLRKENKRTFLKAQNEALAAIGLTLEDAKNLDKMNGIYNPAQFDENIDDDDDDIVQTHDNASPKPMIDNPETLTMGSFLTKYVQAGRAKEQQRELERQEGSAAYYKSRSKRRLTEHFTPHADKTLSQEDKDAVRRNEDLMIQVEIQRSKQFDAMLDQDDDVNPTDISKQLSSLLTFKQPQELPGWNHGAWNRWLDATYAAQLPQPATLMPSDPDESPGPGESEMEEVKRMNPDEYEARGQHIESKFMDKKLKKFQKEIQYQFDQYNAALAHEQRVHPALEYDPELPHRFISSLNDVQYEELIDIAHNYKSTDSVLDQPWEDVKPANDISDNERNIAEGHPPLELHQIERLREKKQLAIWFKRELGGIPEDVRDQVMDKYNKYVKKVVPTTHNDLKYVNEVSFSEAHWMHQNQKRLRWERKFKHRFGAEPDYSRSFEENIGNFKNKDLLFDIKELLKVDSNKIYDDNGQFRYLKDGELDNFDFKSLLDPRLLQFEKGMREQIANTEIPPGAMSFDEWQTARDEYEQRELIRLKSDGKTLYPQEFVDSVVESALPKYHRIKNRPKLDPNELDLSLYNPSESPTTPQQKRNVRDFDGPIDLYALTPTLKDALDSDPIYDWEEAAAASRLGFGGSGFTGADIFEAIPVDNDPALDGFKDEPKPGDFGLDNPVIKQRVDKLERQLQKEDRRFNMAVNGKKSGYSSIDYDLLDDLRDPEPGSVFDPYRDKRDPMGINSLVPPRTNYQTDEEWYEAVEYKSKMIQRLTRDHIKRARIFDPAISDDELPYSPDLDKITQEELDLFVQNDVEDSKRVETGDAEYQLLPPHQKLRFERRFNESFYAINNAEDGEVANLLQQFMENNQQFGIGIGDGDGDRDDDGGDGETPRETEFIPRSSKFPPREGDQYAKILDNDFQKRLRIAGKDKNRNGDGRNNVHGGGGGGGGGDNGDDAKLLEEFKRNNDGKHASNNNEPNFAFVLNDETGNDPKPAPKTKPTSPHVGGFTMVDTPQPDASNHDQVEFKATWRPAPKKDQV
jgi:hypothetical protein